MTLSGLLQIFIYLLVLIMLVKPLGLYMARVYMGEKTFLDRLIGPLERLIYRLAGVNPGQEMDWKVYAVAMLVFNALGLLFMYLIQRLQGFLPLNPQELGAVTPDSSFNTAISFASNTNLHGFSTNSSACRGPGW